MQPTIGITAWRRPLPTFLGAQTDLYTLATEYVTDVARAGGVPIIVPPGPNCDAVLDLLDGLVLTGGDDVDAASYGAMPEGGAQGVDAGADRWEIALARGARERRLPLLGICRGMQILAVAFGGHLVQHLEDVEGHPDTHELGGDQILRQRHMVTLQPGCTLARVYGAEQREVNTIHHQAVADPGTLQVTGYGPGGVIEAIESPDAWPALGIQWHPEKLGDEIEHRLFSHLVESATAYGDARRREAMKFKVCSTAGTS